MRNNDDLMANIKDYNCGRRYTNDGRPNFDRMNRDTYAHRATRVDRYNESTRANYNYFEPMGYGNR